MKEDAVDALIETALKEDMPQGDITSENIISSDSESEAIILAKEEGVLAGIDVARRVFSKIDPSIVFKKNLNDGKKFREGLTLATIQGHSVSILKGERIALNFLQRMSIGQIIILDDEVKPYSRKYIAGLLNEIDEKQNNLNSTERELLSFYEKEYAYELNDLKNERWFLFSYGDSLFSAKFSPIAGYGVSTIGDANGYTRWIGFSSFGTYRNWFGASFDVRDKGEFGDNVDREKSFSPETGAYYKGAPNGIEANDVKGSINFNWNWEVFLL